jgi:hypothetical protein
VFAEQAAIDQRGQIPATLGGEFKAVLDRIGRCRHALRVAVQLREPIIPNMS